MDRVTLLNTLEKSPNFPVVPKELSDIISLLQEPQNVEIEDLVDRIILVDNLESMIIDFINSEFFKVNKKVTSLKEAIIYLGMSTMQVIIITTITSTLFPNYLDDFGKNKRESYLRHSVGTAIASISIAEYLDEGDQYELFAYGLLHDVGVVLYESYFPELKEKIYEITKRGSHQIVAERIVLGGLNHTDIGGWICDKLSLPPNITEVVTSHHWPFKAKKENREVLIINLGDHISTKYYEDLLRGESFEKPAKLNTNNSLNVPKEVIEEIAYNLPDEVERTLALFTRF